MFLRIVYGLIALVALYLCYDIYTVYAVRSDINKAEPKYIYGPDDADLTVVEFLDYGCRYCREVHPTIMAAVKQDGRVRYIPRPIPAKNPQSIDAFIVGHKAGMQDKFFEMHDQLMTNTRPINETVIIDMGNAIDLDFGEYTKEQDAKVAAEADEEGIKARLKENFELFRAYGGRATPMFVFNGQTIYVPEGRMPTVEDFLRMFEQERAK